MRFNKYNDLWTKTTLNTIVERITRRNTNNESNLPLTISAQYGLINQNEFFNKQIASRDLTNYILLNRGEFAYNKSYSSDYPWGAVKRLDKYDKGVLSSLYICFAPKSNVDSDFLVHYFETPKWYNEISNIAGEGARNHGLLNMAVSDYFNTKHCFPSIQEQHKISQFLNLINQRIDTQSKIIEDLECQINHIRHKLFTGYINDDINTQKYIFNKIFISYKKLNEQSLQQYTIGKNGIKSMSNHLNYSINSHIVFMPNTLILGIGIDEIGVSIDTTGCCSPIYKTYTINNEIVDTLFLNIFANDYFSMIKNCVTQKSTRREFEFDYKELTKKLFTLPDIEIQKKDAQIVNKFYFKLQKEKDILELYKKQKAYLLKNMFI